MGKKPLQVQLRVRQFAIIGKCLHRLQPAIAGEFPDPDHVGQHDVDLTAAGKVQNLPLAAVLVGDDFVIDLDAGLLLKVRQQLDRGGITGPVKEDRLDVGALVGCAASSKVHAMALVDVTSAAAKDGAPEFFLIASPPRSY